MAGKSVNRAAMTIPAMEGDSAIRCSFVTLAKARAYQENAAPKFGITMMFDKKNPQHVEALKKLMADLKGCMEEQWKDPATRPRVPILANKPGTGPKSPIKDGDIAVNDKRIPLKEANPEYAGHYIVLASCTESQRPHVVGPNKEAIDPSSCQSGYWYKVNVNAYAYPQGSGGVTVGLYGVQLIREDESLGGGPPPVDDMFSTVAGTDPSLYTGDGLGDELNPEAANWDNDDLGADSDANSGDPLGVLGDDPLSLT